MWLKFHVEIKKHKRIEREFEDNGKKENIF